MDSQRVVKALYEVDPGFVELCKTLYGPAVDAQEIWEFLYTPDGVSKMSPGSADLGVMRGLAKPARGILVPKTTNAPMPGKPPLVAQTKPTGVKPNKPVSTGVGKADEDSVDVVWSGEFAKRDSVKRQAFGWASVVELNGEPVIDLQGDVVTPDDHEDAAYSYVETSRVGGTQHERDEFDQAVKAGHLIESKVWTDEKYDAFAKSIGVDPSFFDHAPRGWEVGFQYEEGPTWDDIEKGLKTGFSIHGRGKRIPLGV
jgi:hypothetical protein